MLSKHFAALSLELEHVEVELVTQIPVVAGSSPGPADIC